MLFNSLNFLGFFLLVYAGYLALRTHHRGQNLWLLAASYVFYGAWDYRFLGLIVLSSGLDFVCASRIHRSPGLQGRRRWLSLSVLANVGALAVFKYFDFFTGSLAALLQLPADSLTLNLTLPVGISFYTFQSLSYTIDVYRGSLKPCRSLPDFALYVSFFPQLVAGPIERASRLLPQFLAPRKISAQDIEVGLYLIIWGYYKKVVVADNLAVIVERVFSSKNPAGLDVWLALVAFAFQVYGDFSGYSSIARGLARLMGFRLTRNFLHPFFAATPSEFWRRWHITLSQWLRDYLYIPLGGSRVARPRLYRNLLLTMGVGGLWHGASWNFVLWGLYHGLLLCLARFLGVKSSQNAAKQVVQVGLTFLATLYGWLLFRATSLGQVGEFTLAMWRFDASSTSFEWFADLLFFTVPLLLWEFWQHRRKDPLVVLRGGVGAVVAFQTWALLSLLVLGSRRGLEFLYFQF